MSEMMTKSKARNIFYGGSLFFFIIFIGLTAQSHLYVLNESSNNDQLSESVVRGKHVWEKHSCINCHTILGEGAYFAPEVGNVFVRYGGKDDPEGAKESIKEWMKAQPTGIEGRRQMPQFNLSEEELDDLANFLEWTSKIDTQGWPPNEAG
ncbi:c-type cytochrome [Cohaesibacter gelatinilyticus]|uniref:Nitric oxide reductase, NorC subunit apoprotein n=1 Tax=Cohaesibacter gelatinilyticus TaxID=372072 RepID=A0A285NE24_9HYPH|nr:cytochrome c [Cohaesibacter gelatinilyticus]SNZ07207.1 nitric oxide reductase, NorC subunit apoprotein [Cohaesibacter gelatinilyticus]HAT86848.1 cytochrome c [Hyphomicrobiales bacterium]